MAASSCVAIKFRAAATECSFSIAASENALPRRKNLDRVPELDVLTFV